MSTSCTRYSPTNCPLTTVVSFFSGRALRHRPKYSQLLDVRSPGHECEDRQSIKVASLGRMTKPSASVRGFTTGKRRSQWSKKSPNCWQIYERLDVFIHKTTTLVSSSYKNPHSLSHSMNTLKYLHIPLTDSLLYQSRRSYLTVLPPHKAAIQGDTAASSECKTGNYLTQWHGHSAAEYKGRWLGLEKSLTTVMGKNFEARQRLSIEVQDASSASSLTAVPFLLHRHLDKLPNLVTVVVKSFEMSVATRRCTYECPLLNVGIPRQSP